ncbi:hypothetical protein BZL39_F04420 [Zygosaccharomyces parabailii]|nr:hypothetical protein BZL39_F04420 [Zygosaccharomyces parabailii]CDH17292.1 uncharacterized protein ZBAI_09080 [Zygosaccharomyces bailii ISA1307]
MKLSVAFFSSYLFLLGSAAPSCYSGAGSYYLQIDQEGKKVVEEVYREKHPDAKMNDYPLNVTVNSEGELMVNFGEGRAEVVEVDCLGYVKTKPTDVTAESIFNGGDHGGNLILDGLNNWTVNWNGPNLNLNMPSSGQIGLPTFNLQAVPTE